MNALLHDLLQHQLWADGELWTAISAHPPARDDQAIRDRFHHIHQVQRFFSWICGAPAPPPKLTKPDEYSALGEVRDYARESHAAIRRCLAALSEPRLAESIAIPWFRDPPLTLTVTEALTQMAMHSHHHRGQNATRLRELGGVPPAIDLSVWYWKKRPAPKDALGA